MAELASTFRAKLSPEHPVTRKTGSSIELGAAVALDEFGEVDVPELKGDGEGEELDAAFVDLQSMCPREYLCGRYWS